MGPIHVLLVAGHWMLDKKKKLHVFFFIQHLAGRPSASGIQSRHAGTDWNMAVCLSSTGRFEAAASLDFDCI